MGGPVSVPQSERGTYLHSLTTTALEASAEFARALGARASSQPAGTAGVEHEYRVMRGVEQLDFRAMVHGLHLGIRDLDPLDPNAYHLASGNAITADVREAEIVTPPVPLHRDHAREIERRASAGRCDLQARLAPGLRLDGYSTHVSVSVPSSRCDEVALVYARTFAPALILLMDRNDSPGLLVRPRPDRLELCGEYVAGRSLRAVIAFAVGSVRACVNALDGADTGMPPAVRLRIEPAKARHGWYIDRAAAGADLCTLGRATPLVLADRTKITAQAHLAACWQSARAALERDGLAASEDLAAVDDLVFGRADLACERVDPEVRSDDVPEPEAHAFGAVVRPTTRPGFGVAPVMITWRTAVMLVADRSHARHAFACIPGHQVGAFVAQLKSGGLDQPIERYLSADRSHRHLSTVDQAVEPGLYDDLGPRFGLLPRERAPMAAGRAA